MASQRPEQQTIPNFVELAIDGITTSVCILRAIELIHSIAYSPLYLLSSSQTKRHIRWLLDQTRRSADVSIQKAFIRAVVTLILNSGNRNGAAARTPRDGQLDAIWRNGVSAGRHYSHCEDGLWEDHCTAGGVCNHWLSDCSNCSIEQAWGIRRLRI